MIVYMVQDERGLPLNEAVYVSRHEAMRRKRQFDGRGCGIARVLECRLLPMERVESTEEDQNRARTG